MRRPRLGRRSHARRSVGGPRRRRTPCWRPRAGACGPTPRSCCSTPTPGSATPTGPSSTRTRRPSRRVPTGPWSSGRWSTSPRGTATSSRCVTCGTPRERRSRRVNPSPPSGTATSRTAGPTVPATRRASLPRRSRPGRPRGPLRRRLLPTRRPRGRRPRPVPGLGLPRRLRHQPRRPGARDPRRRLRPARRHRPRRRGGRGPLPRLHGHRDGRRGHHPHRPRHGHRAQLPDHPAGLRPRRRGRGRRARRTPVALPLRPQRSGPMATPVQNPAVPTTEADFVCRFRTDLPSVTPMLYGHGLLGSRNEATGSSSEDLRNGGYAACGVDWIGMATEDLPNVALILQDVSHFGVAARPHAAGLPQLHVPRPRAAPPRRPRLRPGLPGGRAAAARRPARLRRQLARAGSSPAASPRWRPTSPGPCSASPA